MEAYREYIYHTEPPKTYHDWIGMFLISSALQRKCWINNGSITIWPNLYVLLVGPSGATRKSQSIKYGREILEEVRTITIGPNCPTREALIQAIAQVDSIARIGDGEVMHHCSFTTISPEFGVFMGQNDTKLIADLTDLYDCPDEWVYKTKTAGTEKIYGMYKTILGGITPDGIITHLPHDAIGGGFTSRIIAVVEDRRSRRITKPKLSEPLKPKLVHDLQEIAGMVGEFVLTEEADEWYDYWYTNEDEKTWLHDTNIQHYFERRGTTLLKLGVILSASEGDTFVVEQKHLETSLAMLSIIEPKMAGAYGGIGRSSMAAAIDGVRRSIQIHGRLTGNQIFEMNYRHLDKGWETMADALSTLKKIGDIKEEEEGGNKYYVPILKEL